MSDLQVQGNTRIVISKPYGITHALKKLVEENPYATMSDGKITLSQWQKTLETLDKIQEERLKNNQAPIFRGGNDKTSNGWKTSYIVYPDQNIEFTQEEMTSLYQSMGVQINEPEEVVVATPEDILPLSSDYFRIYSAGIFFSVMYNILMGIMNALGDSRHPLYYLIISSAVNIFLDILLVVGFNMGVAGAAIATVISQVVSAILIIHTLIKSTDMYRLEPKKIRFHKFLLVSIITIGLPAGIQSIMYNISNIIIQTSLNDLGTDTMAAYTAFGKIDAIYWMISGAFSVSIITFIGQNYGAGKYDRMKKSVKVCLLLDFIASLLVSALLLFLGQYLLQLFTTDPEVIRIGMEIIRIIAPSYVLFIFIEIRMACLFSLYAVANLNKYGTIFRIPAGNKNLYVAAGKKFCYRQ